MESNTRTPARAHGLRPLGMPRPVRVRIDTRGEPVQLAKMPGARTGPAGQVARVEEVWRISEEWWREEPLVRTYYQLLLTDGRSITLFHDEQGPTADGWYEQHY
jgi:hypothetical protein